MTFIPRKNNVVYRMSKIGGITIILAVAVTSIMAKIDGNKFAVSSTTEIISEISAESTMKLPFTTNYDIDENIIGSVSSIASSSTTTTTMIVPSNVTEVSNKKGSPAWRCPNITKPGVECSCDFPHTLRCTGDQTVLQAINEHLKNSRRREDAISLLDVTITGLSTLPAEFLENVELHGLVVSTGELKRVDEKAFTGLASPLQALGLPNNLLESVPIAALVHLMGLDRLDLSHNRLKTLEADSFAGLTNLTYLDLCDNLISQLSPKGFESLGRLRSLRMRGNRLSVSALSALRGLRNLEELDLSSNLLAGPLGPNLLPPMDRLRFLNVAENEFVNVKRGALVGLKNLTYLSLSHNQIDVLEDHSFEHLSTLTRLDLANNRIVAVSSASLAHLDKLTILDLTHNVLRSLTADLVVPLRGLQDLRLDDNDITMVGSDVPTSKLRLKRLSLADNPLNCDCTLLEFANWLSNSSLDTNDKSSAVCATPPALENGILTQVSPGSLLCGEPTPSIMTRVPGGLAVAQLTLKRLKYVDDGGSSSIDLLWHVEPCPERYTCDSLIVYETTGNNEIEIESSPIECDSTVMRDPCSLPISIPSAINLKRGHNYRYCVVVMVPLGYDEFSLGLGCSDVIALERSSTFDGPILDNNDEKSLLPIDTASNESSSSSSLPIGISRDRITGVHVNISERGFLHVNVGLASPSRDSTSPDCEISVAIFEGTSAVHREKVNCNLTFVTMSGLLPGRYKVCASLDDDIVDSRGGRHFDVDRSRCVEVQASRQYTEIIIFGVAVLGSVLLIAVIVLARNFLRRVRHPRIQAQCFMPADQFEITHKAHYIKLWATTKV